MDYEINPEEVKARLDHAEAFTLLDVREAWEFEVASIVESKLMPMGDVPGRAHQELDPDEPIVVVCHHGVRSLSVTHWLPNRCAAELTPGRARSTAKFPCIET